MSADSAAVYRTNDRDNISSVMSRPHWVIQVYEATVERKFKF